MPCIKMHLPLVRLLVLGPLTACGSGDHAGPNEALRFEATGTWIGTARGIEVQIRVETDVPAVGPDLTGDARFVTASDDTIPLLMSGDNLTPASNLVTVTLTYSPNPSHGLENYGRFSGSFSDPRTLVGEIQGTELTLGPFGTDTIPMTLTRE
jgi:hypothetical protein